ncbi:DUF624 domain-containing protein [Hamadaea sp. NPDC051192]|uniref:YesL family protein n=1 Tax=Hamadaea sp. NPDC051192 TaxID=3154940 RepID=UPI003417A3D6
MTSPAWSVRLYEAADEVFWAFQLSLCWLVFTLIGGVVLGAGPATLAAYAVARRHARNESFQIWPAFAAQFRREFGRGSLVVLPLAGAVLLLLTNYFYFATMGPAGATARAITGVALVALLVVTAYLLPMAAHYDLRTFAYLPKASLFALTRPAASALLLLLLAAFVYAVQAYPFLAVVAIGGWIQLDTWLCLRFFAENEARLQSKGLS